MSTKKNEEYQSPSCRPIYLDMSGNVMSTTPEIGITPWEEGDEI